MSPPARRTVPLGELVAAAFDQASRYSQDQRVVARLATRATAGLLSRFAPPEARASAPRRRLDVIPRVP